MKHQLPFIADHINDFDIQKVIMAFGGVEELRLKLQPYPKPPSYKAITKWRERGSIPFSHWVNLLDVADKKGMNFNAKEFIK